MKGTAKNKKENLQLQGENKKIADINHHSVLTNLNKMYHLYNFPEKNPLNNCTVYLTWVRDNEMIIVNQRM